MIRAKLYSVDGYQGMCDVLGHTRYILWGRHIYAREGESRRFIQQDAVARVERVDTTTEEQN